MEPKARWRQSSKHGCKPVEQQKKKLSQGHLCHPKTLQNIEFSEDMQCGAAEKSQSCRPKTVAWKKRLKWEMPKGSRRTVRCSGASRTPRLPRHHHHEQTGWCFLGNTILGLTSLGS